MKWYAHYPGDYAKDTAQLSMSEHGAYRQLLDHYYSNGGNVDANALRMYCVCKAFTDADRESVDFVLGKYFVIVLGKYSHARADREIAKAEEKSRKAAASANKRWEEHANASVQDMPSQCSPHPHPHPEPQPEIPPIPPKGGKRKRFVPPSPEEVEAYSKEIGYPLPGQAWCDSYEQKGWAVGKGRMKSWKAAVRTWKANGYSIGQPKPPSPTASAMPAHKRAV